MKIISHRGNINGPQPELENSPEFVNEALDAGFDVEIDVWLSNDKLYLGHDYPKYEISEEFLFNKRLWCHAKNLDALEFMLKNNIQCFWHQIDDRTITSNGYIWTHTNCKELNARSIACWIDGKGSPPDNCYGICTDYPTDLIPINCN